MAVSSTTSSTGTTSTTSTSSAATQLSTNFNTFLQLLTAQLKYQDPTQPMDANQFTQQLVQYSQVEQQLSTNSKLDKLLSTFQSSQTTAALGYLGKTVSYDGSQSTPDTNGQVTWAFDIPSTGSYTLRVRDAEGNLVKETTASAASGASTFTWDGTRSDGKPVGTGSYTLELWRGTGADLSRVDVQGSGQVTSVDVSGSELVVTVGGQRLPASKVKAITL